MTSLVYWRGEMLANSTTAGDQTGPAVTALADGGYVVVWTDEGASSGDTSGMAVRARFFDANGNAKGADIVVNTTTAANQATPDVTLLANGNVVVVWADASQSGGDTSGSAVRGQVLSSTGVAVGGEFLVNGPTSGNQFAPDVVARADGGFNVVWTDDQLSFFSGSFGFATVIRNFDASGTALSGSSISYTSVGWDSFGVANAAETQATTAALANGNYVIAWTESNAAFGDGNSWSVKAQVWNGSGSSLQSLGASFVVNTTTASQQQHPSITGLSGGGFVVTWTDGSQSGGDTSSWAVRGQVFNAAGAKLGGEFLVNTTSADAQQAPTVSALADGGFIVAYETADNFATTNYDLYGQRFDAAGAKVGSEFVLNQVPAGAQWKPDSATLADGRVVFVWQDGSTALDASGYGVHTSILDPREGVQSGAARINVTEPGGPTEVMTPFAATLAAGAFSAGSATQFSVINGASGVTFYGYGITYDGGAPISGTVTNFSFGTGATERAVGFNMTLSAVTLHAAIVAANGGNPAALNALLDGFGYQIAGGTAIDTLIGRAGADTLIGGGGSDTLYGGDGTDVAQFTGLWRDYQTAQNGDGSYQLTDQRGGAPDGTDTAYFTEQFRFSDGVVSAAALLNAAPTDLALSKSTVADGSGSGTVVGKILPTDANALDTFTYTLLSDPSGYFEIVGDELRVKSGATVDLAAATTRDVQLRVTDARGLTYTETLSIAVTPSVPKWGPEFLVETTTADAQFGPQSTRLSNGNIVVAWQDNSNYGSTFGDIRAQVLSGVDGSKIGAEIVVKASAAREQSAEVVGLSDGRFVVIWVEADGSNYPSRGQIYNADGTASGSDFLVTSVTSGEVPDIAALDDGRFFVTWARGPGIYVAEGQLFNANGTWAAGVVTMSTGNGGSAPAVAAQDDGTFLAAWAANIGSAGIQAQLFHADGSKNGTPFMINTITAATPAITALADGRYAVAWLSAPEPASIQVAILNHDGSTSLAAFTAAASTLARLPAIVALPDGGFALTWHLFGTDGQRGQIFDSTGATVGAQFTVSSNGFGEAPLIAFDDGRVMVLWNTLVASPDYSIRAQILDPRDEAVSLTGGGAADTLIGTPLADTLSGGAGNDTLFGGAGTDALAGGDDADLFVADPLGLDAQADVIADFNVAADRLSLARLGVTSFEEAQAWLLREVAGNATVSGVYAGVAQTTTLTGVTLAQLTAGHFVFDESTANDSRTGSSAADLMFGGLGLDTLYGGAAADTLVGGAGNDTLYGGDGDDSFGTGSGADHAFGGAGNDLFYAEASAVTIDGSSGNDTIVYTGDADTISGSKWILAESIRLEGGDDVFALADVVAWPASISLGSQDGNSGFYLIGPQEWISFGWSVASAGDVNNDGYDDLVLSAKDSSFGASLGGSTWVVFGKASGWSASIDPSALDGSTGFRLDGPLTTQSGNSVSSAGDVNGDGYDDLIIGAPFADNGSTDTGSSYVVFGKAGGWTSTFGLASLDGSNGFRLDGAAGNDRSGHSVSSAGDINNDGYDDLIVGAFLADPNGSSSGSSYIVFGKANGWTSTVALSSLNGTSGFRLDGVTGNDESGVAVSSLGDINGDNYDDIAVGAYVADVNGTDSGAAYVVFGKASGWASSMTLNTSNLNGTSGFRLDAAAPGDLLGNSIASAGDVNGDGYDDLIVGGWGADPHGSASGAAYVVFGKAAGWTSTFSLSSLDGANGFALAGVAESDRTGLSVSSAGDVNNDGYDDLIVGAPYADPSGSNSGAAYVVFGKASGWAASLDLSSLDGPSGFRLPGVSGSDEAGRAVSDAGDLNGDGFADVVVGAYLQDSGGQIRGAAHVVFGRTSEVAGYVIDAGAGNDTVNGLGGADTLDGGLGNDTLNGAADTDIMRGDTGDDVLIGGASRSGGYNLLYGGDGDDTASYAGTASGVYADLNTGGGHVGGVLTDLMSSIEHLAGGSGADVLVGNGSTNTLSGGGGSTDDLLFGGGGNDVLIGGGHAASSFNQLWGGDGIDTADYSAEAGRIFVDLRAPAGHIDTGGGYVLNDLMNAVENAIGGAGNDILVGTDGEANTLDGRAGMDLLFGFGGDDVLIGGTAGAGTYNQLWGDSGSDTASYAFATTRVYADLRVLAGWIADGGGTLVLNDVYSAVENLAGGSASDILVGDDSANVLTGSGGADQLYGFGGADHFVYRTIADSNVTTGYDSIADFEGGSDKLDLTAFGITGAQVAIFAAGGFTAAVYVNTDGIAGFDLALVVTGTTATIQLSDILV